jgi:hypothetical protein
VGAGFGSWRHFPESRPTGEIAQKILFRLPGLNRRTELLDGGIIDMEPVSPWHANIGDILSRIFNEGAHGRFRVRVQYPINLAKLS